MPISLIPKQEPRWSWSRICASAGPRVTFGGVTGRRRFGLRPEVAAAGLSALLTAPERTDQRGGAVRVKARRPDRQPCPAATPNPSDGPAAAGATPAAADGRPEGHQSGAADRRGRDRTAPITADTGRFSDPLQWSSSGPSCLPSGLSPNVDTADIVSSAQSIQLVLPELSSPSAKCPCHI